VNTRRAARRLTSARAAPSFHVIPLWYGRAPECRLIAPTCGQSSCGLNLARGEPPGCARRPDCTRVYPLRRQGAHRSRVPSLANREKWRAGCWTVALGCSSSAFGSRPGASSSRLWARFCLPYPSDPRLWCARSWCEQLNHAHPSFATGLTTVRPNGVFVKAQRLSCCGFVLEGVGWQFLLEYFAPNGSWFSS
jgi:hypothetical protein